MLAAPLIVLIAAITIRQNLNRRDSKALAPEVASTAPSAPKSDGTSRSHETQAPLQNPAPPEPASAPKAVEKLAHPQLRALNEAIETSYASTIAAFALRDEEADYETHDARAARDADHLQQLFAYMRPELAGEIVSCCEALIDRVAAAQLQLMAFAINRKNRGLPDSAQVEAEFADRKAFQEDAALLFERIKPALGLEGISLSSIS